MNGGFWTKVNNLYKNIGEKVMLLAKGIFTLCSIIEIFAGFIMISGGYVGVGFFMIIIAPLITLFSTWVLYAFGYLVQISEDNLKLNLKELDSSK